MNVVRWDLSRLLGADVAVFALVSVPIGRLRCVHGERARLHLDRCSVIIVAGGAVVRQSGSR